MESIHTVDENEFQLKGALNNKYWVIAIWWNILSDSRESDILMVWTGFKLEMAKTLEISCKTAQKPLILAQVINCTICFIVV